MIIDPPRCFEHRAPCVNEETSRQCPVAVQMVGSPGVGGKRIRIRHIKVGPSIAAGAKKLDQLSGCLLKGRLSMPSRAILVFLVVGLALPIFAFGQTPQSGATPTIQVTATAVITAKPDMAQIEVGVITQAANAQAATQDNAKRVDATIAAIRSILGSGGETKTIGYSVRPEYRYPKEGGAPQITGYVASNTIQISMRDLAGVGRLIDAATASGGNTIQRLEFILKDDQAVQLQALAEAAAKAKAKAQAIATALGLRVLRVQHAEEQGGYAPQPRPVNERMVAMAAGAAAPTTSIEAGTLEVRASVILTVEVGL
jgi:uncharacterized protein